MNLKIVSRGTPETTWVECEETGDRVENISKVDLKVSPKTLEVTFTFCAINVEISTCFPGLSA